MMIASTPSLNASSRPLAKVARIGADYPRRVPGASPLRGTLLVMSARPDLPECLERHITEALVAGFETRSETLDRQRDYLNEKDADPSLLAELPSIYDRLAAAHERSKASWPKLTDCDRLDAAFDDLNARGIMA